MTLIIKTALNEFLDVRELNLNLLILLLETLFLAQLHIVCDGQINLLNLFVSNPVR